MRCHSGERSNDRLPSTLLRDNPSHLQGESEVGNNQEKDEEKKGEYNVLTSFTRSSCSGEERRSSPTTMAVDSIVLPVHFRP